MRRRLHETPSQWQKEGGGVAGPVAAQDAERVGELAFESEQRGHVVSGGDPGRRRRRRQAAQGQAKK
jgi:hypothetical protein